jgi:hypothetical protein
MFFYSWPEHTPHDQFWPAMMFFIRPQLQSHTHLWPMIRLSPGKERQKRPEMIKKQPSMLNRSQMHVLVGFIDDLRLFQLREVVLVPDNARLNSL